MLGVSQTSRIGARASSRLGQASEIDLEAAMRLSYEELDADIVDIIGGCDKGSGDTAAAGVWHEVTVQPYTDPATGGPALMVTQSEATSRVQAEGALSRLNEVRSE